MTRRVLEKLCTKRACVDFLVPKNAGANEKSFMWVPINSRNGSGSCSENCGFRIAQVVKTLNSLNN